MPKNLPTATQAWEEVSFFSIDTNVIQAAGYNFSQGALHQLPNQLPRLMGLQLPEIVVSEIVKHRMESVHKVQKQLQGATDELHRLTKIDVAEIRESIEKINAIPPCQTTCRLPKLWISHTEATPHEKNPTHPRV